MREAMDASRVVREMSGFGPVEQVRWNRVTVRVSPSGLTEAIAQARTVLGCDRLIQVASADTGETFQISYHMTGPERLVVSLVVPLPRDAPVIPTISGIFPSAGIFERQIHDLMGISFAGHPDLKRIILTEDWPEGEYPMRKDWKPGQYQKTCQEGEVP